MKIAVPKERRAHERRVAASPETVKKFVQFGAEVVIEAGAGGGARFPDDEYAAAGATIAPDEAATLGDADVVLKVRRPLTDAEGGPDETALIKEGATLIAVLSATQHPAQAETYAARGITAIALELMPRITRAQSMDVLSSQSNLAGYKAVLDACEYFDRALPMMMTPAGTIAPAKFMVFGAGVAGLQAIATARRLGAVVSATDVRAAAKEEVESLGAKFVAPEVAETGEGEGGYAREMSEEYKREQAEMVAETLKKQDVAICTALIPGRPAPTLITDEMVRSMRPGSVIVDLAVEQGGNCTASKLGEVVELGGVHIIGHHNWPSRMPVDSSMLFARNILNFLTPHFDAESKTLELDWEDETVSATALTRDGRVVHPLLTKAEA